METITSEHRSPNPAGGDGNGNGSRPDGPPPEPIEPPFERFSTKWPALIVLGIAALLVVGLFVTGIFNTASTPPTTVSAVSLPDGSRVDVVPAATVLSPLWAQGQPPTDIRSALEVPKGTTADGKPTNTDGRSTQYDRTMPLRAPLGSGRLVATYRALLSRLGWSILSSGPDPYHPGHQQILAKRGSSDGYYWEAGVTVSSTRPDGTTPFSIRLFEAPEAA